MSREETRAGRPGGRRRHRGNRAYGGVPFLLIAVSLLLLGIRIVVAQPLSSSPLLIQPVLNDASYQAEIARIADPAGTRSELPRGSLLYAWIASGVPGAGEGDPTILRYVQSFLDAVAGLLLALWAYRRGGRTAGIATLALYALDPLGGFFAARIIPVSFVTAILAAALLVLDDARDRVSPAAHHLALGLLSAVGFLLAPLLFTIFTVLIVWQTMQDTSSRAATVGVGQKLLRAIPLAVPLVLAALLILLRNEGVREGGWTFSWGSGHAAYHAVHPESGGTPRWLEPPTWESEGSIRTRAWEALGREGTSYDLYRFYATRAFQQVIEHPVATLGVLLSKAAATVGAWPVPDALSATFLFSERVPFARHGAFSFAILLALGAAGWWWISSRRKFATRSSGNGLDGASAERVDARGLSGAAGLSKLSVVEIGLFAVGAACLVGTASAASRQPALPLLAALGGVWIGALFDAASRRQALSISTIGIAAGGLVISLAAGALAPSSALRNPSEDLRLVASNFAQAGSWRQAIPLLESSVRADSLNIESRVLLARAYQNDGLLDSAAEQLEMAHAVDSLHVGALTQLSALAMAQGDAVRATALMSAAVNQHPNNPLYLNELGQLFLRTGNIPAAQSLFTRALQIKPDYRIASDNLQVVETLLRRAEQQIYPPEMRLPPDDPVNMQVPIIVRTMEQEQWTQADSLISVIENERGDLVLPHWLRAAFHARRGDADQAIAALERCNALAPCRPAIIELLASLRMQTGDQNGAIRLVEGCLASTAGDPERQADLQRVLGQLTSPTPSTPSGQ